MLLPRLSLLLWLAIASSGRAEQIDCVVQAGALIDGVSSTVRREVSVLISGDRIVGIESGYVTRPAARIIDLRSATMLPGLINMHMHMEVQPRSDARESALGSSELDHLMWNVFNAREMLMRGFTAVRNVGSHGEDAALKRGIEAGAVPGPRMWVALEQLGATGSVADPSVGLDDGLGHPHWRRRILDSPEQAAQQVRDRKKRGADLVKIMVSGAVGSRAPDDLSQQQLRDGEIRAVVGAAHDLDTSSRAPGPSSCRRPLATSSCGWAMHRRAISLPRTGWACRSLSAATPSRLIGSSMSSVTTCGRDCRRWKRSGPQRVTPPICSAPPTASARSRRAAAPT